MPRTSNEERLMALEVKLEQHSEQNNKDFSEVKDGIKDIAHKIDGLDNRYAPKEGLDKLEHKFDIHIEKQQDGNTWFRRNAFNIVLGVGMFLIALLTYLN